MAIVQTDNANYLRDLDQGALINKNKEELELLKRQRNRETVRNQELDDLKRQVEELTRLIRER